MRFAAVVAALFGRSEVPTLGIEMHGISGRPRELETLERGHEPTRLASLVISLMENRCLLAVNRACQSFFPAMAYGCINKPNPKHCPRMKIPSYPNQQLFRAPSSHHFREASQLVLATSLCGAGSMLLLPTTTDAAIVSTPGISPSAPLTVPYNGDGVYLNVLNGLTGGNATKPLGWDFNPNGELNLGWWVPALDPTPDALRGSLLRYSSSSAATPGSLDSNTLVDASGAYSISSDGVTFGAAAGEWKLSAANYFGFQFIDEGDSMVHYGWGILVLGDGAGVGSSPRTITNVFYETEAGKGIAIGAIPEPSSSLLAVGAAGLALLRRRRTAA